jgi:ribosomal protein L18E
MSNKTILNLVDWFNFIAQEKNITICKDVLTEVCTKIEKLARVNEEKFTVYARSINYVFTLGSNPKDDDVHAHLVGEIADYVI